MSAQTIQAAEGKELEERLSSLSERYPNLDPKELIELVQSMLESGDGAISGSMLKIYSEIEALAEYIKLARCEIASLRPDEIMATHLPVAGEELEAIVGATENATNAILEAVEAIEEVGDKLEGEANETITNSVTAIYEACSFQDITGQRISKVVNALKHIESKVHGLLSAFGAEGLDQLTPSEEEAKSIRAGKPDRPDEHLMNGPQSNDEAISQDDIDALLANFD